MTIKDKYLRSRHNWFLCVLIYRVLGDMLKHWKNTVVFKRYKLRVCFENGIKAFYSIRQAIEIYTF